MRKSQEKHMSSLDLLATQATAMEELASLCKLLIDELSQYKAIEAEEKRLEQIIGV